MPVSGNITGTLHTTNTISVRIRFTLADNCPKVDSAAKKARRRRKLLLHCGILDNNNRVCNAMDGH